jgi:hypothetical protein
MNLRIWAGSTGSRYGPVAELCKHGNDPLGFVKGSGFLDKISAYSLFKKACSYVLPRDQVLHPYRRVDKL